MTEHGSDFELERLDQQIDSPAGLLEPGARRLVEDLQQMYRPVSAHNAANTQSLWRVRQRLQKREAKDFQSPRTRLSTIHLDHLERNRMKETIVDKRNTHIRNVTRSLSTLAAVLVVALLIGSALVLFHARQLAATTAITGAHGQSPAPNCSHTFDNGEHSICLQGEETPLSGSLDLNGHHVTLISGYADANRALIRFAATGKLTAEDDVFMDQLTIRDNLHLSGGGSGGTYDSYYDSQRNQTIVLATFDTQAVPAGTTSLQVTVRVGALKFSLTSRTPIIGVTPGASFPGTVYGSLSFTLPFHAGKRVATPDLTMSINGHAITLESVVVTASETILLLQSSTPLPATDTITTSGNLNGLVASVGPLTTPQSSGKAGKITGWEVVLAEPLFDQQRVWTFHLVSSGLPLGPGTTTFQFSVPASA